MTQETRNFVEQWAKPKTKRIMPTVEQWTKAKKLAPFKIQIECKRNKSLHVIEILTSEGHQRFISYQVKNNKVNAK